MTQSTDYMFFCTFFVSKAALYLIFEGVSAYLEQALFINILCFLDYRSEEKVFSGVQLLCVHTAVD